MAARRFQLGVKLMIRRTNEDVYDFNVLCCTIILGFDLVPLLNLLKRKLKEIISRTRPTAFTACAERNSVSIGTYH